MNLPVRQADGDAGATHGRSTRLNMSWPAGDHGNAGLLFDLSGKVALVTGATGGLGRAIAQAMASHGALVVVSDRDAGACQTLVTDLAPLQPPGSQPCVALAADLSQQAQAEHLADQAIGHCGTPLRRVGEPHEVAGIAVMLASPADAFITGQTIVVDGGTLISDGN